MAHHAFYEGCRSSFFPFMPKVPLRSITPQQRRDADALVHALRQGDGPTVRAMLRDGVDPNVPDGEGRLPIMASYGVMLLPDELQALFDAGADTDGEEPKDRQGRTGRSLLVMAVCFSSPGQVQQVLDAGANPLRNGAPVAGATPLPPLSWAVKQVGDRHAVPVLGIVDTLLAAGANVTSLTLLRAAERYTHHPDLAATVAERLLDAGAPLDVTLRQPSITPEQVAWLHGVEVVRQQRMLRAVLRETEDADGPSLRTTRSRARL